MDWLQNLDVIKCQWWTRNYWQEKTGWQDNQVLDAKVEDFATHRERSEPVQRGWSKPLRRLPPPASRCPVREDPWTWRMWTPCPSEPALTHCHQFFSRKYYVHKQCIVCYFSNTRKIIKEIALNTQKSKEFVISKDYSERYDQDLAPWLPLLSFSPKYLDHTFSVFQSLLFV